ncbi:MULTISPECIES: SDR family NAD(P)-dependent oxidoreductase [unclassified Phenylobacterium]|uniref:SDR family NAD(P)-dependent oxidoreductase n=1 Tax=unclassified Phenylobacterium TaxID=2640670 RepID=UPI00083A7934|nr:MULTISPECIES: SDR family NAD(P)-dependent oxidoreductase [unclassified Phenylobacterium]
MKIEGVAAIVTGGASGLGAATGRMLASRGAKVTLFDLNEEAGEKEAAAIGGVFRKLDVSDDKAVADAVAAAEDAHGVARILANCAGVAHGKRTVSRDFEPHPLELFRRAIEINLIGTFNVLSKVAARLARAEPLGEERGVIINTASVAAFEGQVGQPAYAASKGGVVGLTLPIARELAPLGIRVVTIAPGIFWTPMLGVLPKEELASLGQQVPFPARPGQPDEYAMMVESIVANPMLNGETIRLDGAIRMPPRFR